MDQIGIHRIPACYLRHRNTRQPSTLSAEENAKTAGRIRLKEPDQSWLGASIVIAGISDLTHIPPGSRLQTTGSTTLTTDLKNAPTNWSAKEIETDHPGRGQAFKSVAKG